MSTATETPNLPAPIVGKFNIALTQSNFQKLADKAATLVYNEDNLDEIKSFLDGVRKVEKAIEETHKDGKAEALQIGRQWDSGKNSFLLMTSTIKSKPQAEYTRLCNDIEDRKRRAALEQQRVASIKQGIESNALKFATDIAACTTSDQLSYVERIINLEKGKKDKYAEFADEAISRYNELNALLKTQKETIRQLEENARLQAQAKLEADDAALLKLQEEAEVVQNKVEEAKITVQETAINQSMKAEIPVATEVIPEVKARRTTWEWEIKDIKETAKKMPDWTTVTVIESKVDEYLKAKRAEGITGEEFTVAGIRFFQKKTF